jgi:RES domain-containing protein
VNIDTHVVVLGQQATGFFAPGGWHLVVISGFLAARIVRILARDAWWFTQDGSGRFDLIAAAHGTCYFADRPVGAWIEVFRKRMLLPEAEVAARTLFTVQLGRDLRLADLTSRRALQYGITASVGAGESYAASHEFAAAALDAGFDGVRYPVRHDPAQKLYGYALFGAAGAADPGDPRCPAGTDTPLPNELVDEAARLFGYRVIPTP